jgi:hypothetical protein
LLGAIVSKAQFVVLSAIGLAVICYVSSLILFISTASSNYSQVLLLWFLVAGFLFSVFAVISTYILKMDRSIRFTSIIVLVIFIVTIALPFILLAITGIP